MKGGFLMYLSYDEYLNMGGELDETTFYQLEFEARSVIDWWTFNRLQREESFPEAVKRCMMRLVQLINDKQKAMSVDVGSGDTSAKPLISQESNDGVSVSYNTLSAKEAVDTMQDTLKATVQMYLSSVRNSLGHKVLYRGIYPDE